MALRLYNTRSRTVEDFAPREDKMVHMFVCGPTVYDNIHIGNARPFTFFDVVAKWLRYRGYDVTYIQNITDIDDRIIVRAGELNTDPLTYAHEYDDAFRAATQQLGNDAVSQYARATDYIPEIIAQVQTLLEKGYAYELPDGIYYDLSKFKDYGKLSGRTSLQSDDSVSRIDENRAKRNSGDFCLWKKSKPGEPVWDSPWGPGRPGWHIEDTAITEHFFGPQYDLHGGGRDLIFPHHEAEIAQQEAASGLVPFVKYWMHSGFLENKAQKMSKSLGNFMTLKEALEQYEPAVIRFYLLSNHYRAPLEFNDQSFVAAQAAIQRIREVQSKLSSLPEELDSSALGDLPAKAKKEVEEAMDDDFNTPQAFAAMFDFIRELNGMIARGELGRTDMPQVQEFFDMIAKAFGIVPETTSDVPVDIQALVDKRQAVRDQKDWNASDALRGELASLGWTIDDTPYGPLVKRR